MSEHDLLALLLREAPAVIPDIRVFRRNIINRTVLVDGRKVHLRNGIPGQGDAYALVRGGRHIEIETKAAKGIMRARQEDWQAFCASWGVSYVVLKARRGETSQETVARWCAELEGVVHGS